MVIDEKLVDIVAEKVYCAQAAEVMIPYSESVKTFRHMRRERTQKYLGLIYDVTGMLIAVNELKLLNNASINILPTICKVGDEMTISSAHQSIFTHGKIGKVEYGISPNEKHYNTFIDIAGAHGFPISIRIQGRN